jgi:hypothetical protein
VQPRLGDRRGPRDRLGRRQRLARGRQPVPVLARQLERPDPREPRTQPSQLFELRRRQRRSARELLGVAAGARRHQARRRVDRLQRSVAVHQHREQRREPEQPLVEALVGPRPQVRRPRPRDACCVQVSTRTRRHSAAQASSHGDRPARSRRPRRLGDPSSAAASRARAAASHTASICLRRAPRTRATRAARSARCHARTRYERPAATTPASAPPIAPARLPALDAGQQRRHPRPALPRIDRQPARDHLPQPPRHPAPRRSRIAPRFTFAARLARLSPAKGRCPNSASNSATQYAN